MDTTEPSKGNRFKSHLALFSIIVGCILVLICGITIAEIRPPQNLLYSTNVIFPIENGASLNSISVQLYNGDIIRSPFLFKIIIDLLHGKNHIGAGDYVFAKPENAWSIAERLVKNEQDLPAIRITLPEGLAVLQMAPILNTALGSGSVSSPFSMISRFNEPQFLSLASTSEGYLFPDTYLFLPNDTAATVISTMKENFNSKIASIQPQIDAFLASSTSAGFHLNQADIVIMASIIEKEATSTTDRRIISGILWKRLESGQLLEADPTLVYANLLAGQKISAANTLTGKELLNPSPYNTYKYKGLPPTPIDNPGLDALTDTVNPVATDYWYYLSDSKGVTHYSVTYAQQLANQAKYLGN